MISRSALYFLVHGVKPPRKSPRRRSGRGPSRNWKYRAWIRSLPCAACGAPDSQAAHTGKDGGMAQKPSDYSCIPFCVECHAEYDNGMESKALFEKAAGIDTAELVRRLNHDWFAYSREVK